MHLNISMLQIKKKTKNKQTNKKTWEKKLQHLQQRISISDIFMKQLLGIT